LIHYYKKVRLNLGGADERFFTAYCFGYETRIWDEEKKSLVKCLNMIMPTGEVIITENPDLIDFK